MQPSIFEEEKIEILLWRFTYIVNSKTGNGNLTGFILKIRGSEKDIIEEIKTKLSDHGAFYSAMSGSGSSVFGLFDLNQEIDLPNELEKFVLYRGKFEF